MKLLVPSFLKRKKLTDRKTLGIHGEKRCEKYLKKSGLKTLTRNYLCKTGELDLVMADTDGTIVFVEVKSRTSDDFAEPEDSVTYGKQAKLIRAAKYFLKAHKIEDRPYRFDVVTVTFDQKGRENIIHYKNAFTP